MKMRSKGPQVQGRVEIFHVYPNGDKHTVFRGKNTIVNSGSDILAKALAGELAVNGMYLRYFNGAGPVASATIPATRTATYYHNLAADEGIVRVATLAEPSYASSDETTYDNNNVVFVSITDSNTIGAALTDGLSNFFQAALVVLDSDDYTDDILFSAAFFLSSGSVVLVPKIANAQVGVRWTVSFTTP